MAFSISNPHLPAVARVNKSAAPAIEIKRGNLGPLFKINYYQKYGDAAFESVAQPTPDPVYAGRYYKVELGRAVQSIQVPDFSPTVSAVTALPLSYWSDEATLSIYSFDELEAIALTCELADIVPLSTNNQWKFTLPDGFIATQIICEGLGFVPGTGEGTFAQAGAIASVTGFSNFPLTTGAATTISGIWSLTLSQPTCNVATFILPDIAYLDRLDWMGVSFSPAVNALSPQPKEFTWNEQTHCCNAFLNLPIPTIRPALSSYDSSLGSVQYDRPVD